MPMNVLDKKLFSNGGLTEQCLQQKEMGIKLHRSHTAVHQKAS